MHPDAIDVRVTCSICKRVCVLLPCSCTDASSRSAHLHMRCPSDLHPNPFIVTVTVKPKKG